MIFDSEEQKQVFMLAIRKFPAPDAQSGYEMIMKHYKAAESGDVRDPSSDIPELNEEKPEE